MITHDWIKAEVALHMVDVSKGSNMFPYTPNGSNHSTRITTALEKVMNVTSVAEIVALLNKRVRLGQYTLYVITYLDRESGRLHDSVLAKFCNAFFSGLPE